MIASTFTLSGTYAQCGLRSSGLRSCVVGGASNHALGEETVVVGGGHASNPPEGNSAGATRSVIVGGSGNSTAIGHTSVVSGGFGREAPGAYAWVAGTLLEDD